MAHRKELILLKALEGPDTRRHSLKNLHVTLRGQGKSLTAYKVQQGLLVSIKSRSCVS